MNIQEIKLKDNFCVLFSDSHTNLSNIKKLQELYPGQPLISLGDLTFLFSKPGETWNHKSIDYFIQNKIPACRGNHEEHIIGCSTGDSFIKILPKYNEGETCLTDNDIYDLTQQQIDFLRKLPIGFKLILPSGKNVFLFHNSPRDLWGFYDKLNQEEFLKHYPIDKNTLFVCRGHHHFNSIINYPKIDCKLITIGQLCNSDHHTGENSGKNYGLLTEKGIEFKKL